MAYREAVEKYIIEISLTYLLFKTLARNGTISPRASRQIGISAFVRHMKISGSMICITIEDEVMRKHQHPTQNPSFLFFTKTKLSPAGLIFLKPALRNINARNAHKLMIGLQMELTSSIQRISPSTLSMPKIGSKQIAETSMPSTKSHTGYAPYLFFFRLALGKYLSSEDSTSILIGASIMIMVRAISLTKRSAAKIYIRVLPRPKNIPSF